MYFIKFGMQLEPLYYTSNDVLCPIFVWSTKQIAVRQNMLHVSLSVVLLCLIDRTVCMFQCCTGVLDWSRAELVRHVRAVLPRRVSWQCWYDVYFIRWQLFQHVSLRYIKYIIKNIPANMGLKGWLCTLIKFFKVDCTIETIRRNLIV